MKTNIIYTIRLFLLSGLLLLSAQMSAQTNTTLTVTTYWPNPDTGSLSEAIAYANAHTSDNITINFAAGVNEVGVWNTSVSNSFACLPISARSGSLTIDGNCAVTIFNYSGAATLSCFEVNDGGGTVTFRGLTIKDFNTEQAGAAIHGNSGSKIVLDNVNFLNNKNTGTVDPYYRGGAFFVYGGTVTLKNRIYFEGNQSVSGAGGAMAILYSTVNVTKLSNIIYFQNTAYEAGGAVFSNFGTLQRDDYDFGDKDGAKFTFTANKTTKIDRVDPANLLELLGEGGAIYHGGAPLGIADAVFNSNQAVNGGAIFLNNELTLSNCTFNGNIASDGDVESGEGRGGAIYALNKINFVGDNNLFTNNYADNNGGAIRYENSNPFDVKASFIGNTAMDNGGAIFANKSGLVTIYGKKSDGTPFTYDSNIADDQGGFICAINTSVASKPGDNILISNSSAGYSGGAIQITKADITLTDATFRNNTQGTATREGLGGGAVAVLGALPDDNGNPDPDPRPSKITLNNVLFENNKATKGGAVASLHVNDIIEATGFVRFFNNTASFEVTDNNIGKGGAIYSAGNLSISMTNPVPAPAEYGDPNIVLKANFHDNKTGDGTAGLGGGIYCEGKLELDNVYFHQNRSQAGGGICLISPSVENKITNSLFMNGLSGLGGAIRTQSTGKLFAQSNVFRLNQTSQGGAINAETSTVELFNNTFDSNSVRGDAENTGFGDGGAIFANGGTLYVGNGAGSGYKNIFTNNTATSGKATGAAICATGGVTIAYNEFTGGNLAGKKNSDGSITPGAVIAVGNFHYNTGSVDHNTITGNTGTLDGIGTVASNGVGFHDYYGTSTEPVVGTTISNNVITNCNYGVFVPAYVKQTEISQNTYGNNNKNIHTIQPTPRAKADNGNLSVYGNLGLGKSLLIAATGNTTFNLKAAIPQGLASTSKIELYGKKNGETVVNYLTTLNPTLAEATNAVLDRTNLTLTGFDASADSLFLVSIDDNKNTSEFSSSGIALQINITDETSSGIDWTGTTLTAEYQPNTYSYFGPEMIGSSDNKGVFYVDKGVSHNFKLTLADNSKKFGAWAYDGTKDETINMEAYRVAAGWDATGKKTINDYKLLAIVDGTADNPFRNNTYSPDASGNFGGGLIVKGDASVTLSSSDKPVGSLTAGQLNAGYMVVEPEADFIVNNATLNMQDAKARLIIEKTAANCGIFALDNNANLTVSADFMALYHYLLSSTWAHIASPQGTVIGKNALLSNVLYSATTSDNKFFATYDTGGDTQLYVDTYREDLRATEAPSFTSNGTGWDPSSNGRVVKGFNISIDNEEPTASDMYLYISDVDMFKNATGTALATTDVSFTQCNRADQYKAAAQVLGKPNANSITSYAAADPETRRLVAAYHSGWNLIGNPYSKSYKPASSMGTVAMPNENGTSYIYQNALGIVSGLDNSGDFSIPPMTSFFVQAPTTLDGGNPTFYTSQSLPITYAELNNNNALKLRSSSTNQTPYIRIDLLQNNAKVGETVLAFAQGATPYLDWGLDAVLMGSAKTTIYMPDKSGSAMAINVIGNNSDEDLFAAPIGINLATAGDYAFRITEINNISAKGLILKEQSRETQIEEGTVYPFSGAKGKNENTFAIARVQKGVITDLKDKGETNAPIAFVRNNQIVVGKLTQVSELSLIDVAGSTISMEKSSSDEYIFPVQRHGVYIVLVKQGNIIYKLKVAI